MTTTAFKPGDDVDRYRLEALLGAGTFGEVWRARKLVEGEDIGAVYAVKIMRLAPGTGSSGRNVAGGWLDEVKALFRVSGGAIPAVDDAKVWNNHAYIAMELLEGDTLSARIKRGRIPWRRALFIAQEIARALEAAHGVRVIHRDLKPQNVILAGARRVCVVDWGIARLSDAAAVPTNVEPRASSAETATHTVDAPVERSERRAPNPVGTPGYIAPEVYEGAWPAAAQDVFALGVVLFEMLTGRLPQRVEKLPPAASTTAVHAYRMMLDRATQDYDLESLESISQALALEVPRGVRELVTTLLARDASGRPPRPRELIEHVARFPFGLPSRPYVAGSAPLGLTQSGLFSGHEDSVEPILKRLETQRAVLLSGPAGSGKSSFATAGIAAQMDAKLFLDVDGWIVHSIVPGDRLEVLDQSPPGPSTTGHVVVVDQLESVAELSQAERSSFCSALAALLEGRRPIQVGAATLHSGDTIRVLATVREDLEWRLEQDPELRPLFAQRVITKGVDANCGARLAAEPARAFGFSIEGLDVVAREIDDCLASDATMIPFVQLAFAEWWERRDRDAKVLPLRAWRALGGVLGALGLGAETLYTSMDVSSREKMRALLLRFFVGRRPTPITSQIADDERQSIEALVAARLVVKRERKSGSTSYELARPEIVECWRRLAEWLEDVRHTPYPGQQLTPSVRLLKKLGGGAMGSVWLAQHETLETEVVVKFMSPDVASDSGAKQRFSREAIAAAAVRSPHVVQVFDHGIVDDAPFIVMERLQGEDLRVTLDRQPVLPLNEVTAIVEQACKALSRAHGAGFVHRDIKPDNIFLTKGEHGEVFVKLLDFGIAKRVDGAAPLNATKSGVVVGTPYYMSPQQALGEKLDHRTDLWSLAVVAFEALTGKRPFDGESIGALVVAITHGAPPKPSESNASLPRELDAWFARACARDPADRFSSAKELADTFIAAAKRIELVPISSPKSGGERAPPTQSPNSTDTDVAVFAELERAKRGRTLLRRVAMGVVLTLVLGVIGVVVTGSLSDKRRRNAAWTDVSMCLFGGPPPSIRGQNALRLRALERAGLIDAATTNEWPTRCASTIDVMVDSLGQDHDDDIDDLRQKLKTLSSHTSNQALVDSIFGYADLFKDVEEAVDRAKVSYVPESSHVKGPPAPVDTLDPSLLTKGGPLGTRFDFQPAGDDDAIVRYYRADRGRAELLELDGATLRAHDLFSPSCAGCADAVAAASWGTPRLYGSPNAPLMLAYSSDDAGWVVRATDGALLVPQSRHFVAGVTSTPTFAAALSKLQSMDSRSEEFVLSRMSTNEHTPRTERITLQAWVGPGDEWSSRSSQRVAVRLVDDWVVWITRDGSVNARRLFATDPPGPVQTIAANVVDHQTLQDGVRQLWTSCRTRDAVVVSLDPMSIGDGYSIVSSTGWLPQRMPGRFRCEGDDVIVQSTDSYVRCAAGTHCGPPSKVPAKLAGVTEVVVFFADRYVATRRLQAGHGSDYLIAVESVTSDGVTQRWLFDGNVDGGEINTTKNRLEPLSILEPHRGFLLMKMRVDGKAYWINVHPQATTPEAVFTPIKIDRTVL